MQEKYKRIIIITVISFGFIAILASVFYFNRRKLWKSRFTIKTTLGDKEANDLAQRLNKVMQTKKPYLDEDLTLIKLAELMSSTQKKLSVVLNNHLQTNFYDYVNKYRVQAFKEMIENPAYKEYGTLGVANECGFKSKSSFYRVFKKETGLSPGIYKRQILEKIVP